MQGEINRAAFQRDSSRASEALERLIEELSLSLLGAYHSAAVEAPEHEHAAREVCRLHSSVSSAPVVQSNAQENRAPSELWREFQPDDDAPGAARQFLEETLQRWGGSQTPADDARLLLTELVTNAVVHARSPLLVSIRRQRSRVRRTVVVCG